ncbi:tetratricopeptide repeat protein [Streptomyces sp. NPDC102282]|uniref:tetratricopeptide repeat protein n=1 Tax=Streptomyces sp. NPDC102282 TaxID=3366154 RepID=UPI00380C756A
MVVGRRLSAVSRTLHGRAPAAIPDVLATTCAAHTAGEYAVTRMTRAHMMVDTPDGMDGGDEDLAELRVLSRRVGDRYLRAQVASADAEAGMTRGRYEESRAAYQEALALAREVGAHGEEPFLLGRLAELSYQAGDLDAATKGLDEAEAAAERRHMPDAHAYVHDLRAAIALTAGENPRARRYADSARSARPYGSRPPQFAAAVLGLSARISVSEPSGGPAEGLRGVVEALALGVEARCVEVFTAHRAEVAAIVLAELGLFGTAARVLGACELWRAGGPRSAVEEADLPWWWDGCARSWGPFGTRRRPPWGAA